jgi:hypothetical protein
VFLLNRNGQLIGVTEPRRVAAISMSKRVAYEMNLSERYVKTTYPLLPSIFHVMYPQTFLEKCLTKFDMKAMWQKRLESSLWLMVFS